MSAVTTAELWRRGQVGWPRRFPVAQFPTPPLLLAFAVGPCARGRGQRARCRPRSLHPRPRRVGVGGGGQRGQLVPSPSRGGGARLGGCRAGGKAVRRSGGALEAQATLA